LATGTSPSASTNLPAESGVDEAFFDAFAVFTSLDQMLDFTSQVIARTGRS
jgi:hypothetical protein